MSEIRLSPNKSELLARPAFPEDAQEIAGLQRATWLAAYPNEAAGITHEDIRIKVEGEYGELIAPRTAFWEAAIASAGPERATFVVRNAGTILGFVAPHFEKGERRLGPLYVLPEAQHRGIGSVLIRRSLDWHGPENDILLRTASYNDGAIALYQRFGFAKTDRTVTEDVAQLRNGKRIPQTEMIRRAAVRHHTSARNIYE